MSYHSEVDWKHIGCNLEGVLFMNDEDNFEKELLTII